MASGLVSRKWVMRLTFAVLCLAILFLQLLPLETTPRRWAGPDWLVVLTVAWAARHPAVFAPIISARSVDQLNPSLQAMTYDMSDEVFDRITALSPTPPPATDRSETT